MLRIVSLLIVGAAAASHGAKLRGSSGLLRDSIVSALSSSSMATCNVKGSGGTAPYNPKETAASVIAASGACTGEDCGLLQIAQTWRASGGTKATCAAAVVVAAGECGTIGGAANADHWCANTESLTGKGGIWQITGAGGAISCGHAWSGECGPFNSAQAAQAVLAGANYQLPLNAGAVYTCQSAPTTVPDSYLGPGKANFIGFSKNGTSLSGSQSKAFCHVGGGNGWSCQESRPGAAVMWGGGQCAGGWQKNARSSVIADDGGCSHAVADFEDNPQKYTFPDYYYDRFLVAARGSNDLDCDEEDVCGVAAMKGAQTLCEKAYASSI